MVLRYLADGSRDPAFSNELQFNYESGEVRQSYPGSPFVRGLGLFFDAADALRFGFLTSDSAVVAGRQANGALDDAYGDHGYGATDLHGTSVEDSAGGPDGSGYFVGTDPGASGNGEVALVAYKVDPDGKPAPYAASAGTIRIPYDNPNPHPFVAAVDAQGTAS